jgi:hypothetical protein
MLQSSGQSDVTSIDILNVFDKPVKDWLSNRVKELGYDSKELLPLIEVAVEQSKVKVKEEIKERVEREGFIMLEPVILGNIVKEYAYTYIYGALSQTKKFNSARERVRSYSSIFLVGAGISFESGVPLTILLNDLLRFCSAKDYAELRSNSQKCKKFKLEFKRVCDTKNPSASHKLIALNFPQHILEIISLNWDNLIERAARELGKEIPKVNEDVEIRPSNTGYLWKFHGDVENIKDDNVKGRGGWVFPDEDGYVFNNFKEYVKIKGLLERMFVFVIAGYSEKEENIYNQIISIFQKDRPTYRVGLDLKRLHEEFYIVGPAEFVLKQILPIQL